MRPNIVFDNLNPILTFKLRPNIAFWHSKSYFDNRNEAEYCILTFKLWPKIIKSPIMTSEFRPSIVFLHSKSYFDVQNEGKYIILTFKILFWHSNWGLISYFDIQYSKYGLNSNSNVKIGFWMSNYDIRSQFECQNRSLSKKDFECLNAILMTNSNIKTGFSMSKCNFRSK